MSTLFPMDTMDGAIFSECRVYRYSLWRRWTELRPMIMFIGLNPSTADEKKNDPTIRRLITFAKAWDFGGMYMGNLFAYRATNPQHMKTNLAPIGPDNDEHLVRMARQSKQVVACWGNHGRHWHRSKGVLKLLHEYDLAGFGITGEGEPKHPLYLSAMTELIPLLRRS